MSKINLPALEKFDLEGDNASITLRWEKWKRSLNIYFETCDIENEIKKRAILLHYGGPALQDIYYNLLRLIHLTKRKMCLK